MRTAIYSASRLGGTDAEHAIHNAQHFEAGMGELGQSIVTRYDLTPDEITGFAVMAGGAGALPFVSPAFRLTGMGLKAAPRAVIPLYQAGKRAATYVVESAVDGTKAGMLKLFDLRRARSTVGTGGRLKLSEYLEADLLAEKSYDSIRVNSSDVSTIAQHTGMPEFQIQRVKKHLFINEHQLTNRVGRFTADPLIVEAWHRLETNAFTTQDLSLLKHEVFEAKFEGMFKTDYVTAHLSAKEAGHLSPIEGLSETHLEELYDGFLRRIRKNP